MTILADHQIAALCHGSDLPMIHPYIPDQVRSVLTSSDAHGGKALVEKKILSYGTSSYGYDVRIQNKFKIFTNINSTVIDPLAFDNKSFVDFEGDVCIIPPNSFVLACTVEYFNMPLDVTGIVLGKSTYARCGCMCLATPLEAGWSGEIVLEFANTTPLPMKLYAGQGAAQVLFFKGDSLPNVTYAQRGGKYQNQRGIQLPIG